MTRVLLAFADTGGGHRAAASAIEQALHDRAPHVHTAMVDPYARCARWPFNRLAGAYPRVVDNATWLWHGGFRLTNTVPCTATLQTLAWPALRDTFRQIGREEMPDVVVSTHPLLTAPLRRALPGVPLAVVVTDLVSGHVAWYHRHADLVVVPTQNARMHAIACGVSPERLVVLGVPVAPSYVTRPGEAAGLRAALGWHATRPTVLLVGGGDGVGPLEAIAANIDAAGLPCDVAVVTGRNVALAERLRTRDWRGTVHVYGFVRNLGEMMRAAGALVTKAGPGTISEACAAGCPMVLYGAIPGQETGNVSYVCDAGAGVWAPEPEDIVQALAVWLVEPLPTLQRSPRARAVDSALALARPHAANDIAARVLALASAGRDRRLPRPPRLTTLQVLRVPKGSSLLNPSGPRR